MITGQLATIAGMRPGIDRHGKIVGALISAGQLLQGVEDQGYPAESLGRFVHELASAVIRSWDSRFAELGDIPLVPSVALPPRAELRLPEGFAFYAVYPEAYAAAARRLRLRGKPVVIGVRSIGTTLGAVVSVALGSAPALTVRPFGDPFARSVELKPEIVAADAHYVIVDEGPGLSGSSFGAVADWLEDHGVLPERIAFLSSHGGELGPQASCRHRERWASVQRIAAEPDLQFLVERFAPLKAFSTARPGERLKFRSHQRGEAMLIKFAGLGAIGERKLEMAHTLHDSGFTPEPLGLVHGFLVERWCEGAQPLGSIEKPLDEIGRYIGARARLFPARQASGASVETLTAMCRRNIGLALGENVILSVDIEEASRAAIRLSRVRTDNKLDREEWLRLADGRLIKTDALDHHQSHDLIGCQDIAWDVAGAIVEFDLDAAETERLIVSTGGEIDAALLRFLRLAYVAFRLGEAEISGASSRRYARQLDRLLANCSRNRPESSFD
ncbi:MAG: hypothetical protein ACJ8FI_03925 [Sphingomicrobium sp.]